MESAISEQQLATRNSLLGICNTDCLCAYCDPKEGCENERCEKRCDGLSRVKQHCDDFAEIRGKE